MSCIRFKFKNALEFNEVTFKGLEIPVADLREKIMNKMSSTANFTVDIMDAQKKKVFSDDSVMIPRNSSVVIIKTPKLTQQKFSKIKDFSSSKDDAMLSMDQLRKTANLAEANASEEDKVRAMMSQAGEDYNPLRIKDFSLSKDDAMLSVDQLPSTKSLFLSHQDDVMLSVDQLRKTANLAEANASEEDKVRAMMSQAGEDYNPLSYAKFKIKGGGAVGGTMSNVKPPPANYICHRCNQKGHWIKFCPTNGDPNFDNMKLRQSYGIPSSQLTMSTTNTPGAMMDRFGNIVIRKNDLIGTSKKKLTAYEEETVPPELTCKICKEIVKEAVIVMCCAESFCAECITSHLINNDFSSCYSCDSSNISIESLVPNKPLREAAKTFLNKKIERKSAVLARGLPSAPLPPSLIMSPVAPVLSNSFLAPPIDQVLIQ